MAVPGPRSFTLMITTRVFYVRMEFWIWSAKDGGIRSFHWRLGGAWTGLVLLDGRKVQQQPRVYSAFTEIKSIPYKL